MPLSKPETKALLERLIFEDIKPEDWVQDVWGLSPMLGESAAKLLEVFHRFIDEYSAEDLERFLEEIYQSQV